MRMDSKCKYWMLLLTLLCVISLGFSLFRVFPCEVGNETFLGIVLSAVGIIVTLVMGYQIFSVVEFRGELQKQKEENIKLAHDNAKLQQMIRNQMGALDKQKGRIEEGLNMCFSYINYFSGQDVCTAFGAFVPMLDALYYSLILMKMVLTIYSLAYGYLLAKSKHNLLQYQEGVVMFMESI